MCLIIYSDQIDKEVKLSMDKNEGHYKFHFLKKCRSKSCTK